MKRLTLLFPLFALVLSAMAFAAPWAFMPLKPAIVPLLGIIMFGMGMTLTAEDFRRVLRRPGVIALGTVLQYTVMPLGAFLVAMALGLPPDLIAGMVLVGSSAGGTASNVICYLARGDVALSITLTMVSTLLAVLATPSLTWLYSGQLVPVPVANMLVSVLKIVVIPVALGATLNTLFGRRLRKLQPAFPLLSMIAIVAIIAIIVALNQGRIAGMGLSVLAAVALHNALGLTAGYWLPRWLGHDKTVCRTLAIEVGMQNSGLSVALAVNHFSVAAALPGAVFSIWHNLSGSLLAAVWGRARH
ncbi:MAG: bile acid:sodium symporter family protein [Pseudomonadota bacterium]|nr:MAG: bile acid:sodium symporter family protein [Pseudomonadota bacterium]